MSEYFRKPIVKTLMLKGQEGQSIKSIKKTGTSGLADTYTITLTDGTTSTFTVTNGNGIKSILKTDSNGLVDTYTITYNDGTTSTFTVTNGEGLQNLQVGGRNLIKDSKGEFSDKYPTSDHIDLGQGFNVALPTGATHFVLSFDAKSTVTGDKIASYFYDPSNITKSENSVGEISTSVDGLIYTKLTNDWDRYWVKWTAPIADKRNVIVARMTTGEGTGTVSIRNIKLEIGTVPTDWTPAPEDLPYTSITNSDIDTILNS